MPRFPVNFRRKSTAADDQNGPVAEPSFRVLERPNSGNVKSFDKSFDGGVRFPRAVGGAAKANSHDSLMEDNLFAGLHSSRGSSNTTKTGSDNSSRHSNASMTPSSTEYIPSQEEWRNPSSRKPLSPVDDYASIPPVPPVHKSSGFLKQAGRTFSFGGSKKNALPPIPSEESAPPMPDFKTPATPGGRSRATTASTVTTATPPKLEDSDFKLDLGGEWSSGMLTKFDKRSSVMTLKEREGPTNRPNQPSPLHLDHSAPIEPPPKSWNSQRSNEGLLASSRMYSSPVNTGGPALPPPAAADAKPRDKSPDRRESEEDTEDTTLLSDLSAASKFLSSNAGNRAVPNQSASRGGGSYSKTLYDSNQDDGNIFDKSFSRPPRVVGRIGGRSNTSTQNHSNKVMTPEEFEKYRDNKAKEERLGYIGSGDSDKEDEEINYDDDEDDELEKSKQIQRQRRKQEAHLSVYRQQMMKVTGESSNPTPRPAMSTSLSTPNLPLAHAVNNGNTPSPPDDGSDEDEEVPLAILAAHGFPGKNRPPTRLSTMGSQPNLRGAMQASASASTTTGDGPSANAPGSRLPPFARKLPQDPYLGAGLINQPPRESIAFAGGSPAPSRPLPTGGLVGVIANEERARALRRGSPAIDNAKNSLPQLQSTPGFDPINGIPPQMMYPMGMQPMQQPMQAPMLTPGDQAQIQMNQQMHQFMQMQMQFMQMMASQNASHNQPPPQPMGHMPSQSVGQFGDMSRNSFMGGDMARNSMMGSDMSRTSYIDAPMSGGMGPGLNLGLPQGVPQTRTMSMVQPSSASWIQQAPQPNYLPSIQIQGGGYAPSIAPSERSNIGLPGRYRPVSSIGIEKPGRTSTMSAAIPAVHSKLQAQTTVSPITKDDDDDEDDDEGWAAMKAKREQKKSFWRSKKSLGSDIGAFIN
ncbi:hypothetical protein GGR51DRAFT_153236 [Nemania sp. FL0031]|nr:hypothetical protein GGR51DRAFT_153236 [Nemania sp. FL0031]